MLPSRGHHSRTGSPIPQGPLQVQVLRRADGVEGEVDHDPRGHPLATRPARARRRGSRAAAARAHNSSGSAVAITKRDGSSVNSSAGSIPASAQPVAPAAAISARATASPPPDTSWTARTSAWRPRRADLIGDEPGDEGAQRRVRGEVDGRHPRCRALRWSRRSVAQRVPSSGKVPSAAARAPSSTTASPSDHAGPGGCARTASTRPSTPSTGVGSMSDATALVVEADVAPDHRQRQTRRRPPPSPRCTRRAAT